MLCLLLSLLHARVEIYDNGQKVKTDMVKTNPAQEDVYHTTAATPGKTVTLK
jgi:hypothetical protein